MSIDRFSAIGFWRGRLHRVRERIYIFTVWRIFSTQKNAQGLNRANSKRYPISESQAPIP